MYPLINDMRNIFQGFAKGLSQSGLCPREAKGKHPSLRENMTHAPFGRNAILTPFSRFGKLCDASLRSEWGALLLRFRRTGKALHILHKNSKIRFKKFEQNNNGPSNSLFSWAHEPAPWADKPHSSASWVNGVSKCDRFIAIKTWTQPDFQSRTSRRDRTYHFESLF